MNDCDNIRELIALQECGLLAGADEATVNAHLATCAACAAYRDSIRKVCDAVRSLEREAQDFEPAADLHEQLVDAIRANAGTQSRQMRLWKAAALAAGVIIAIACAQFFASARSHRPGAPLNALAEGGLPTLAVYQRAISLSPGDFDALLTRHESFCPRADEAGAARRAPTGSRSTALYDSREAYYET